MMKMKSKNIRMVIGFGAGLMTLLGQARADSLGLSTDFTATGVGLTVSDAFAPTFGLLASSAITLMAGLVREDLRRANAAEVTETLRGHQDEARAVLAAPNDEMSPELRALIERTRLKLQECNPDMRVGERELLTLLAGTDWSPATLESARKEATAQTICK